MTVRVLGALDIGDPPLSPRERTTLAVLVVRHPAAVSPAEIADALWSGEAPPTWPSQVKTSIARLRRRLGPGAIATRGGTYGLTLEPDAVDAERFERLVASARAHAMHAEPDRAADEYGRALALWRGRPYPDLADWEPGAAAAQRLEEIRRDVEEERVDAQLHTGEAARCVPEAERLVQEWPLRERRWGLLARAQYRAGRQADALDTLRTARTRLLDELGIEPGAELTELETAILQQDPALTDVPAAVPVSAACPYRGLDPFEAGDADTFFGRDADLDLLVDRVRPGEILTITGPSGSGKSSLAQAGLLARLTGGDRRSAVVHPSTAGLATLRAAAERPEVRIILVDQAEELVRQDAPDAHAFCDVCADFLAAGGSIIVTIRSDFLDAATALPRIGTALGRGAYALAPIAPEAYRDIIELPARGAGLRCEPGLVELIVRDTAGRTASLPLVSYALVETWARREGSTLTIAGYEASGGIAGAIAASAETAYQALSPERKDLCRSLMLRLVERDPDSTTLRRHPQAAPLRSDPARRAVLDSLFDARLITTEGDALVIAHEAVASAWPRLDAWLDDDARDARIFASVSTGSDAWNRDGRPDDQLLRGGRLAVVREWKEQTDPDLTEVERAFVETSEARHEDRAKALERRARHDRRQNRMLRLSLVAASVLLVVAIVAGGIALVRGRDATAAAEDQRIEAITAQAQGLIATNRDIAALMAVAAYRRWPKDPRTRASLLASVTEAGPFLGTTTIRDADWRVGMWPIPHTTWMAIVRDQVHVEIIDYLTGALVRRLPIHLERPNSVVRPWVRVSADGSTLAVMQHFVTGVGANYGESERIEFVDLRTGAQIGSTIRPPTQTDTMSLSPDGARLTWATTGTLVVVDRDTGTVRSRAIAKPDPHGDWSAASAFGPDGKLKVATSSGRLLDVDPATLTTLNERRIPGHRAYRAMWITTDGSIFGIGGGGMVSLAPDGTARWTRAFRSEGECSRPIASAALDIAACSNETGAVQVWNLHTGADVAAPFTYQEGGAGDLAWSSDEHELLLLSSLAPQIGRLRVDGSGLGSRVVAAGQTAISTFDTTGTRLITEARSLYALGGAGSKSAFSVWDAVHDRPVFRVPQDVKDHYDGFLTDDPRWITDDLIATWQVTTTRAADGSTNESTRPRVIDIRTGRFVATALPDDTWELYANPDRTRVYVTTGDGSPGDCTRTSSPKCFPLRVLDTRTLKLLRTRFLPEGTVNDVIELDNGRRVVVARFYDDAKGPRTTVFDGTTGEMLKEATPHMYSLAAAGHGSFIAWGQTGMAQYSSRTFQLTATLPVLPSRTSWASTTQDGRLLLSAGQGQNGVSLVDLARHRVLGSVYADDLITTGAEPTAVIDRGGTAFAVSMPEGVAVWTLDAATQAAELCRLAGGEPTAEQWHAYFAVLGPQHPLCPKR